jgi:hypothetical protein
MTCQKSQPYATPQTHCTKPQVFCGTTYGSSTMMAPRYFFASPRVTPTEPTVWRWRRSLCALHLCALAGLAVSNHRCSTASCANGARACEEFVVASNPAPAFAVDLCDLNLVCTPCAAYARIRVFNCAFGRPLTRGQRG